MAGPLRAEREPSSLAASTRPVSDWTSSYPDHKSTPSVLLTSPVNKQFLTKRATSQAERQGQRENQGTDACPQGC